MMHGTLNLCPAASRVDVFGDADPCEPVRIAIPLQVHVSFAELLTLLLFTPGATLTYADLQDDNLIRETVRFALVSTDLLSLEDLTNRTMAMYRGETPVGQIPPADYVADAAAAITRVFGVTA
ncbi:hypothetical protein AB0G79_22975 [Streptomyces sp. NPDC020807]|uniref:hypothetical protein n=1 Tax=Streptomyces sp. NPDC020807 TaxID=3155119 RepID=UPI00340B4D76